MYNIRAVERAFKVLECFTTKNHQMGITELADASGLSKATAFRIAETLETLGYLNKDAATQNYSVAGKVLRLGQVYLDNLDFRTIALPYMKQIRDMIDETVSLYIAINEKRVCVERVHSSRSLRIVMTVGEELPLTKGASARVLVAFSNFNPGIDEAILDQVRKDGYAYTAAERDQGTSAVSVPIRNFKKEVIAALTISGPSFRYNEESLAKYIPLMKEFSAVISAKLGYNP